MRRLILLLALLLCGAATTRAQVRFVEGTTDDLRRLAIEQQKLVFIDLTATWCGYCRLMDSEVFSTKEAGDYINAHFIAARYDVDKPTGRALMRRYEARGVPYCLVFDTEGNLLGRIGGACNTERLIKHLQRIVAQSKMPK